MVSGSLRFQVRDLQRPNGRDEPAQVHARMTRVTHHLSSQGLLVKHKLLTFGAESRYLSGEFGKLRLLTQPLCLPSCFFFGVCQPLFLQQS